MKTRFIYNMLIVIPLFVCLAGCTERGLSERPGDGPLKIHFVWPEDEEAVQYSRVTGASLWLYNSDGVLFYSGECPSEGYEARVPEDTYTAIVVNSDYINAECGDEESMSTCCISADEESGRDGYLLDVDKVFCGGVSGISVKGGNKVAEVTINTVNVVKYLHFDIDPNYLVEVSGMEVTMSGVVPAVYLYDGDYTDEPTAKMTVEAYPEGGMYYADMSVFGYDGENVVYATIVYEDGTSETTVPQDISDALEELPDEGGEVDITLVLTDGGEIPVTVTVGQWEKGSGSGTIV